MEGTLNILSPVKYDDSLAHYEIHSHQPYVSSAFNNSDEIRIAVQHQDLYVLPCKSTLHVHGRLIKPNNTVVTNTKLISNGISYLFNEIRYELNGVEIDRCKNVGLTTTMKTYISQTPSQIIYAENAGYIDFQDISRVTNDDGYFDVNIPLSMILGFAEDYRKIVVNAKHELILTRSRTDLNAIVNIQGLEREEFRISINKIEWMIPYLFVGDRQKIELLRFIEKDPFISMSFRSWEMYEYPLIPATQKHVWTVKTSTQVEKPRYVILGFQTNRKDNHTRYANFFDNCNLINVKLFLNSQYYPYGNLNLDFNHHQFSILYDMYCNFQASYYGKDSEPLLTKSLFKDYAPLAVIDCSKQNEFLKQASVDVRLEFESSANFPPNTAAYCLIIHDRVIQYKPISGVVKKVT
ncbi:uncharacterized protein LOC127291522 [Leptopilina boulardi]|uniref:uncharacterized protein LOC127277678 n=1 Tax=Leptopilina boulardi TaxID=63433 RepID=UPI0021F5D812|nr:uncharacterized protein LOC127277678 [Leptopilina boulardi]XP_051176664.1 uncharacterized protein LOC127291522 [Leptopilina boulardi]